jgi:hypothetical protein
LLWQGIPGWRYRGNTYARQTARAGAGEIWWSRTSRSAPCDVLATRSGAAGKIRFTMCNPLPLAQTIADWPHKLATQIGHTIMTDCDRLSTSPHHPGTIISVTLPVDDDALTKSMRFQAMKARSVVFAVVCAAYALSAVGCATNERLVVRSPAAKVVMVKDVPGPDRLVVVATRPPAPRHEVRPRRPGAAHVWVSGYWKYAGSRYVWVAGRWVVPPRHNARWLAGHWSQRGGSWVFVKGRWRL